jgi:hypothetical protein
MVSCSAKVMQIFPLQQAEHRAEFVCYQRVAEQTEPNALFSAKCTVASVRLSEINPNLITHLLSADRTVSTAKCT